MPAKHIKHKHSRRRLSSCTRLQTGGSPASNLVMNDTAGSPPTNDYVVSPRVRDAGADNSLGALAPSCQTGGSPASELVMKQLNAEAMTDTRSNSEWPAVKGDMNSLNLYQTTGGARRRRSRRSSKKSRKSRKSQKRHDKRKSKRSDNRRSRRGQRGGGSDWIMSQYSQGPINNPEASTSGFSQSMATARDILMNPPNLGSAGSGAPMTALEGANVRQVGAPLV